MKLWYRSQSSKPELCETVLFCRSHAVSYDGCKILCHAFSPWPWRIWPHHLSHRDGITCLVSVSYTHCSFQCLRKTFSFETSLLDRLMTGNLHSNSFFFPEFSGVMNGMFVYFPYFFFHHMISHFPLVVFRKFRIYLSTVMGGNCRDVVPFSLTHPMYSWFGSECRGCGPHRQGENGSNMHNFPKPTHWFSTQELSVFKTGCRKDHVSFKTQRGVKGDFVDYVLLPKFFHCCIRPTVKVVLCVTSSIGEWGKIRLALDKNFCFFIPHHRWKKGLYKKFHYPI